MVKKENAKITEWKKREVEEIKKMFGSKKIVGIIDIHNLPSAQFQEIRKKLRGKADIKISKLNLIQRAIDASKDEKLKKLENYIKGPSGIIVSDENPFSIFKFIKQNRSRTFAKPGMIAEEDIIVPAGETDIPPGPALSELKIAGIDVRIDKRKIVVAKDSIVTKKGEAVTPEKASALSKLGITPREIGLEISVLLEGNLVYTPDILDIDEEAFAQKLQDLYLNALNLSVNAGYYNKESVEILVQKACSEAMNLALNANVFNKQTIENILVKAGIQGQNLKTLLESK